jgi:hypothetical protein
MLPLYAFIFGYLTGKIFSGSHEHIPGPIGSIFIRLKRFRVHVHHWILGFLVITILFLLKSLSDMPFSKLDFSVLYFFIGVILQGIIEFKDWKEVIEKV